MSNQPIDEIEALILFKSKFNQKIQKLESIL